MLHTDWFIKNSRELYSRHNLVRHIGRFCFRATLLIAIATLTACGGGNSNSSPTMSTASSSSITSSSSSSITSSSSSIASSSSSSITPIDNTPPVITLNGNRVSFLRQGSIYQELGATALDDIDGAIVVAEAIGTVDYNTVGEYELVYTASDNSGNISTVTRTVHVELPRPFITTWKTDNEGISKDNQITINTNPEFTNYNYNVDWGDGTASKNVTGDIKHTYSHAGVYTVSISGEFPQIYFKPLAFGWAHVPEWVSDNEKLLSVEQWGNNPWLSMHQAFTYCNNVTFNAVDAPDLTSVTDMSGMFTSAGNFNGDISQWDVSSVIDMSDMFLSAYDFNQDIGGWNVSAVTNMSRMFVAANAFDQDIGDWDVSAVTNMSGMFSSADAFNQDISTWNVSAVTDMSSMFRNAESFNQNIDNWDVSAVTDMSEMFYGAESFNQDIGSWDVSAVTDMSGMFTLAYAFNQDIGRWDVSAVTDMSEMFGGAVTFNQNINNWDVSAVTDMSYMFSRILYNELNSPSKLSLPAHFNQYIGSWDVSSVSNMAGMFYGAQSFNQDIGHWDVSAVTSMHAMFRSATAFNQDIGNWDVKSVKNMNFMFAGLYADDEGTYTTSLVSAHHFNQDIGNWDVSSVTNMHSMFAGATFFDQNIGGWDVSSVTYMQSMFRDAGVSTANYDSLLTGWSTQDLQSNVIFNAGNSQYSSTKAFERSILTDTYGWTITDGGVAP